MMDNELQEQINQIYDDVEAQLREMPESYEEEIYILKLGQERIEELYKTKPYEFTKEAQW